MNGEENPKLLNVDPQCIQEALRMYLQPIKNDDPLLDFYTMYKQETMEYDTDSMRKYDDDLNISLIFAGLFSAVSSAFVIDVQSQLQPDPIERSEAYLRAILLSLDPSIAPEENPTAPPVWNGPPREIVATSDLLYASLLMSLLAAFFAMLGKQWLNRYLRHAGGSMVERCGDRQRKFNGLEKWPFRLFIESLPIMLQIALLLLACGLSRYMWSVNTSVARVIISFVVLGGLFYTGIVFAGLWSYECPFQTPTSMIIRYLRGSRTIRNLLATLSPPNILSLIHTTQRNTRGLLMNVYLPNATSFTYAAWMDAHQRLVSVFHRITRNPLSLETSLSCMTSGIHNAATKIGHRTVILFLRIDRAFTNAKQVLVQAIRRSRRTGLLPTTIEGAHHQPPVPGNDSGLRVRVWNPESIRRQNADNARCVCWVLHTITDPEAINSAIRLAGTIRWFDSDSDHDPPFDFIVSTFEACFDSTKRLYPGMRDRAYFSARAILQISLGARAKSHQCASKYPIPPATPSSSFQYTDPDLHHVICMLERNFALQKPAFEFPSGGENANTYAHSSWASNLLVDMTRAGTNPTLKSYESYLSIATKNHQPVVANTLLLWYMFLGGQVEEETFWAVDKSDSLETILPHLSTRVKEVILDGNWIKHLYYLLEFLAAWEKRPACLAPMAYEWCSTISEAAGKLRQRETPIIKPHLLQDELEFQLQHHQFRLQLRFHQRLRSEPGIGLRLRLRQRHPALGGGLKSLPPIVEGEFSKVGPGCDLVRLDGSSCRTPRGPLKDLALDYAHLLSTTLEIGFRLAVPDRDQPALHLDHTPHHGWVFETAFSSYDDEVIADAVCAWTADGESTPLGSFVHYFAKRVEREAPFSWRLRWVSIRAIERIWPSELKASVLETVRLLDRLVVEVDDMVKRRKWGRLLVDVICSPAGPEILSPHYWRLLDELVLDGKFNLFFGPRCGKVMKSLDEAEDWEKLEVWMGVAWRSLLSPDPELAEDARSMTLKLLSRRPSALPRFESLCGVGASWMDQGDELRQICDQAQTQRSPLESPAPQSTHPRCQFPSFL